MTTRERAPAGPVVIEAAINGGRSRTEHPGVPCTPEEVADEARRCAAAGAAVVHIHARSGEVWSASPAWYAAAINLIRSAEPVPLISLTSIRPGGVPVNPVLSLLDVLARGKGTRPDLISVNLGHIVNWAPPAALAPKFPARASEHFPNDHDDIVAILLACQQREVTPELGIMDLGFVSNAVALRDEGVLPEKPWFLIELDSAGYGAGRQVAPSTVDDYHVLVSRVRKHFPGAPFAAHGVDVPGFDVVRRAIADGGHVRVGFEDSVRLPNGAIADSNVDLVEWAVREIKKTGRTVATMEQARRIVNGS